jgi:hypothetical protein
MIDDEINGSDDDNDSDSEYDSEEDDSNEIKVNFDKTNNKKNN